MQKVPVDSKIRVMEEKQISPGLLNTEVHLWIQEYHSQKLLGELAREVCQR